MVSAAGRFVPTVTAGTAARRNVQLQHRSIAHLGWSIDNQHVDVYAARSAQLVSNPARCFLLIVVEHDRVHAFVHDDCQV